MEGAWFVRADGGETFRLFRDQGLVALGWKEVGRCDPKDSLATFEERFARAFPEEIPTTRRVWAGQVRRFLREPKAGDRIVTYDAATRLYLLGRLLADLPEWVEDHALPRVRSVRWELQAPRDALSSSSRNTLGSVLTIFRVTPEAAADLWSHGTPLGSFPPPAPVPDVAPPSEHHDDSTGATERENVVAQAAGLIEDRIMKLAPSAVTELVAGIFRAMGYRTRLCRTSVERVDVFASTDGLGLQEPRIFIEVKHRSAPATGSELVGLSAARQPGERCVLVSTGGFTNEAHDEAARSTVPVTLVDLERLRELLVDHYDKADATTRALVPLSRVYWPAE